LHCKRLHVIECALDEKQCDVTNDVVTDAEDGDVSARKRVT